MLPKCGDGNSGYGKCKSVVDDYARAFCIGGIAKGDRRLCDNNLGLYFVKLCLNAIDYELDDNE